MGARPSSFATPVVEVAPERQWSFAQRAVFDYFENGTGHLIVRARAGAGKTSTIIEGVNRAPEESILLCAFNRGIADTLNSKITNSRAEAKTLHGVGMRAIGRMWRGLRVAKPTSARADFLTDKVVPIGTPYQMKKLVSLLHTKGREMCPTTATFEAVMRLALFFNLEPSEGWAPRYTTDLIVQWATEAMAYAAENPPRYEVGIDFADMIYLPLAWDLLTKDYQLVVVDECLPGWTPVMLHDGTSMTIQEIVESDQSIRVRSYDTVTGEARNCRVTARQKLLNQKPLVKVSIRYPKGLGNNGRNFVTCTIDHKLWTSNRGWVPAGQIRVGDSVIIETAAKKTQKGKITATGRANLVAIHQGNKKGIGNKGGDPVRFAAIKGGNGRGLTLAEQVLSEALGPEWTPHYAFPTGCCDGLPTHYKLDIANIERRIAVEVDGSSHSMRSRRLEDRKKEEFLEAQGWTVFRVSNMRAVQNPYEEACRIAGNCPHPATVVAVEPAVIPDDYVYDITVEDCHNFYANGVLVHNCQDMNAAQLEMVRRVCDGRLAIIGDDRQSVYQFRGADTGSMDRMKKELGALELPLNTTYRCGRAIVERARLLVPDFEAGPNNPVGVVEDVDDADLMGLVRPGDFVLSRLNAPLVSLTLRLLRSGVRARMAGRDIGAGILNILKRCKVESFTPISQALDAVDRWERKMTTRYASFGELQLVDQTRDQADMLRALMEDAEDMKAVMANCDYLFTDDPDASQVVCSSVHKAKGLESTNVFVLMDSFYRRGVTLEEDNLLYVATTRAISYLGIVRGTPSLQRRTV